MRSHCLIFDIATPLFEQFERGLHSRYGSREAQVTVPASGQTSAQKAVGLVRACVTFAKTPDTEVPAVRAFAATLKLDLFDMSDDPAEDPLDRMLQLSLDYGIHLIVQLFVQPLRVLDGKNTLEVRSKCTAHDGSPATAAPDGSRLGPEIR